MKKCKKWERKKNSGWEAWSWRMAWRCIFQENRQPWEQRGEARWDAELVGWGGASQQGAHVSVLQDNSGRPRSTLARSYGMGGFWDEFRSLGKNEKEFREFLSQIQYSALTWSSWNTLFQSFCLTIPQRSPSIPRFNIPVLVWPSGIPLKL